MAIGDGFRATVAGWSKPRRTAFAIGVGGFVMAGAMWGASLKIERDVDKTRRTIAQLSPEIKIQHLETTRARYVQERAQLEAKIDAVSAKIARNVPPVQDSAEATSKQPPLEKP